MNERERNIDSLRTLCALFVVIVHVCAPYLSANTTVLNSTFCISSSIQIFTRIAVPIFVLISGRYLLSSWDEKDLESFYKKRYSRIIIPFIFAIVIYGVYRIFGEKSADITSYLKDVIMGQPYGHLWYFYMLIGLYAIIPILYKIKDRISHKAFRNLGFVMLIVAMMTQLAEEISGIKLPLFYFIDYVGFFITGYTLKDYKPKFNKNILLIIYLLLCVFGSGLAILLQSKGIMLWMVLHMGNNIVATPAAIFLYLYFSNSKSGSFKSADLGKYTLGIYIVHNMFVTAIMNLTNNILTGVVFIDIILYVSMAFICSLVVVRILWNWNITRRLVK